MECKGDADWIKYVTTTDVNTIRHGDIHSRMVKAGKKTSVT